MASFKQCLFMIVVCSWSINVLESTCTEPCICNMNKTNCQICSYDVTVKDISNVSKVTVCCGGIEKWTQQYVSKILLEVKIHIEDTCNLTSIYFDLPLLNTYSISIRNSSLDEIKLNIKGQNLRELDLSENKLRHVTNNVFNYYFNLRKLDLSKNQIMNIMEGSFSLLSKLELLDLSENNLTILNDIFIPLKNLQHLNLSKNNIEFIHEESFNNWLLQHLDVSHNKLKKVAPGALQLLPNLARLLLTDNPHLGITQIDTQLLVGTGRRLQQIDVSRTGLYQVPEAFTHSVRFLSLVGNMISAVRCGDLDSYPLLQSLDFSDNKIIAVEEDSLGRLEMLLFLNINKNILTAVPKSLPSELKYLSLNNNWIQNLSIPDFKNLPNLRILLLQNNQIGYIQDHVFDDLLSLEILDLSNNPIQMLSTSTFDGPLFLKDLRLCYVNLTLPEKDGSFPMSSPESIQMLHLQSSPGLARQLLADSAALAAFTHLQYLDLRMNNLTELRSDLLFYLVQLKTLRLHGNSINCSAQLWLKDWMSWNKTLSGNETCYFASLEAKDDIARYNCSFPETFTISDSLPPVNLYSTEMINKLLRYYGYLNKSDKFLKHLNDPKYKNNGHEIVLNKEHMNKLNGNSSVHLRSESKIIKSIHSNGTSFVKLPESSRILDQGKTQDNQVKSDFIHQAFLVNFSSIGTKKESDTLNDLFRNNRSGKRLNTPVNMSEKIYLDSLKNETLLKNFTKMPLNEMRSMNVANKLSIDSDVKTISAPYQSTYRTYIQYIGPLAVSSLIAMSLILWASFRLRYRRRRIPVVDRGSEDQIEVSNISGGVLW